MCAPSKLAMNDTIRRREEQYNSLLDGIVLKHAIQKRIAEGRELWGPEWAAWYSQFCDDNAGNGTWKDFHDLLVLEIERRKAPPEISISIDRPEASIENTP